MSLFEQTVRAGLCIGCGFCAAVCPSTAITMMWTKQCKWKPIINTDSCDKCGLCLKVCPHSINTTVDTIKKAYFAGIKFGLPESAYYFTAYDSDLDNRMRSPSGGALTAFLKYMLNSGEICGVISTIPISAPVGKPHVRTDILYTPKDLDNARGSHYQPVCYNYVLRELKQVNGKYAIIGLPCIVRSISKLPTPIKEKLSIVISLVCSHNVTGRFIDCLAYKEGIDVGYDYFGNLRKKNELMVNANQYFTYFKQGKREIITNRFNNDYTDMWRNYFFAQTPCFYCADFFGNAADLSVKDAWGPLSSDPRGLSLIVIRNQSLIDKFYSAVESGYLTAKNSSENEFFNSQGKFTDFKHITVKYRAQWNKYLRRELINKKIISSSYFDILKNFSSEYFRLKFIQILSNLFFRYTYNIPVKAIIKLAEKTEIIVKFIRYIKKIVIILGPVKTK